MSLPDKIEDPGKVYKCTVRGHDHELKYIKTLVQKNSESFGYIYECPTGAYRYLVFPEDTIPGGDFLPVGSGIATFQVRRFKKPRWGW